MEILNLMSTDRGAASAQLGAALNARVFDYLDNYKLDEAGKSAGSNVSFARVSAIGSKDSSEK